MEYLLNRLTPFNFKIYYKEEKYLKVKTVVFKYITPPYSKDSVYQYIVLVKYITFPRTKCPVYFKFYYMI